MSAALLGLLLGVAVQPAGAASEDLSAVLQRLDRLESENAALRARVATLEAQEAPAPSITPAAPEGPAGLVGTSATYAAEMLEHTEGITERPLRQLEARAEGELAHRVILSGGITAIADWQSSNSPGSFGYLMRHPTIANQVGDRATEIVLHSAQLALTATVGEELTGYVELLYDPEQSFGPGTITALTRNQVQLRRGWILWGNLDKRPVYALIGKLDVPFGLMDTLSPFTNSSNYHAFGGLAFGGQVGLASGGLHVRAMAVQGGAQFRAANTPVDGTAVPSRTNNFALDGRYTLALGEKGEVMAGASYLHGSPYCQAYPVTHFSPCAENVPAWAAYGRLRYGPVTLLADYATTTRPWPGSAVPDPANPLSIYEARDTESFTLGARLGLFGRVAGRDRHRLALSAEFSRFRAGDSGSPWEKQDQWVGGIAWLPDPAMKLFAEYVHVDGFVPLNFLSGGNLPDGSSWSSQEAKTDVVLVGGQMAF
ncbi:hypothetical protein [Sphingomicrobium aestuariivivum]|uniref:hypothetical protein n=1 Tax=Sphingomicrobium aestuariivivum TaxID=1582356 RepID=UPI001FD6BC8E|nr:hypothetical protein [Sphingomicrobium aestuariivivum]MCJ8191901.1 hypothetical protein [Sphingomicrobium aestuariivivum]